MGITTLVDSGAYSDANLAMALGGLSKGVSPIEMAAAYAVLANNGTYHKPVALLKIVDRDGKILYEADTYSKHVIDEKAAYMTVNMMEDVFTSGTAGGMGIGRPAAGKTGTTDTFVDAWFVGFTPDLSTAVWVGDDSNKPMDYMYGSSTPLSIWHDFMISALASTPKSSFINPGVKIPPEPEIKQDDKEDKDKKDKNKAAKQDSNTEKEEVKESSKNDSQPAEQKRSMKQRVQELLGDPVVSNKPVSAN